jgi:predicted dehydrogenase
MARSIAPGVASVTSIEQVLESDVAGIVIATPAVTHAALARRVLEAGKDVMVEKPLAMTSEDGLGLVRLADLRGRILMVGHVLEYHPAILELRRLVSSGELGEIRYIYSNRLNFGKVRRDENVLWSFAPHDIAVILRLIGESPTDVMASGYAYLRPGIADVTVTHLSFANQVRAHIFVSWLHPFKEQRLVVVGADRMASFDDVAKKLILYDQHVSQTEGGAASAAGRGVELPFSGEEPLRKECEAFLEAISSRKKPVSDGSSALAVLKVLQAAQNSLAGNGASKTLVARKIP